MDNDKLVIGGHEFRSRFILGSGKYSLNLIEAAIKDGRSRDHYTCRSKGKYKGAGKYLGFYSKGSYIASEYQWRKRCKRSSPHCQTCERD